MSHEELNGNKTRFDVAVQTRNLEIELFWKRSLFFWGFISAAFIGYAALRQSEVRTLLACFGLVCSFAWTLVNRGSKYWQEAWEAKVERFEFPVTGVLFAEEEAAQSHKGCWLSGRKYSVSKLAIALSDYVCCLWLVIVVSEGIRPYIPGYVQPWLRQTGITLFVIFSAVYAVLLLIFGRKSPRPQPVPEI
jgi:hypothetical protein